MSAPRFAAVLLAAVLASTMADASPPNVVLIVADDLGYGDVGFHGSTQIRTPHLDALAGSGVRFAQGYVSSPVCSPSRAGLITGRNQVRFGYDNNLAADQLGYDPEFAGLDVREKTLADRLRAAGHVTGLIGKWHLGARPQFHPLRRGFDEFIGFLGGGHSYFPTVPAGAPEPRVESSLGAVAPITYLTDDLGSRAVEFIARHRERPFFLFLSFNAPHTPMQATAEDLALYSSIDDEKRRTYCAMVHRLDVNVGRVVDALARAGLTERTLVAFLGDNGGPVDQNSSLNAPLNGQKGTLLEGGLRVPFLLSWPGTLPAGAVHPHPVTTLDLTPTFLAAAGRPATPADGLDGVDLLPFLRGERDGRPHATLLWRFTIAAAIREGDWKLIRLPDRLPMLFNLAEDPAEQRDVATVHLDRTRGLLGRLGAWDVRLPHPHFLEGAVWKARQLNLYDSGFPLEQPEGGATPVMIPHGETM